MVKKWTFEKTTPKTTKFAFTPKFEFAAPDSEAQPPDRLFDAAGLDLNHRLK